MTRRLIAMLAALLIPALGAGGAAMLFTAPAIAQDAASVGPKLGSHIDDAHRLLDTAGRPVTLGAFRDGKPLMMVLVRSAKWCPYCQAQLMSLKPIADYVGQKGARLAVISYDDPRVLADFTARHGLNYATFSDTGAQFIRALGLTDPRYPKDSFAYGVPYPTVLVYDRNGRLVAKHVDLDYRKRPSDAEMKALADQL